MNRFSNFLLYFLGLDHELKKDDMVIFFLLRFRKMRFPKMQFLKDGVQTVGLVYIIIFFIKMFAANKTEFKLFKQSFLASKT